MAQIERDFINRLEPTERDFQAPPFIPRRKLKDLGNEPLDGERYFSPEFMQAEWDHIWRKTWQLGTRVDYFEEPGDFWIHELGKESFIFVMGEDDVIRGFYNMCRHRGNRICLGDEGGLDQFTCPFHGWQWNIDGSLKKVVSPELFRQFDNGVPEDELALVPVKLDFWGGWVWFNMDLDAIPVKDYLGEAGRHLETYEFEKFSFIDYQTFEWNGNWKHAWDAFNESYHFASLHPDMIEFGEGHDIPIELLGIHSRMLNFNQTVSQVVEDQVSYTPLRSHVWRTDGEQVPAKDLHLQEIAQRRSIENDTYLPFQRMNDEQLVHQYHYSFFPGTTFTQTPEFGAVFRYRPHASDPNICYYDFFILAHLPPGRDKPVRPEHKVHRHADGINYLDAFEGTFDPVFAKVLSEDGSNMPTMQAGVKSDAFTGMILSEQEVRIRHFHQVIDGFLDGSISTGNLPDDDAYFE